MPRTENTGMDGGPCGKGAVLLRLLGRKSLASSTLAPSASRSAVIGHGIGPGIQSAKRVGSAWRNAVGHTCPMRSRTFLLGVTAAHGSLEPLVLVRIQEEELGGSTSNRFSLYTRFDVCCTGYRGFRRHPSRETMPRPCSPVDRASASGAEGHESDSR